MGARISGKTQEIPLKRMNFEERKNVPQNARISAAQEFRAKRKDFGQNARILKSARISGKTQGFWRAHEFRAKRKDFRRKRKKFRGNARRKKARNPTATNAQHKNVNNSLHSWAIRRFFQISIVVVLFWGNGSSAETERSTEGGLTMLHRAEILDLKRKKAS